MLIDLTFIALGLVLLVLGASSLVRGAAALALRWGLTPLVVGLTVVAFGTSAPELVVSVQAALAGRGGIAVGNVVGSNIANVALILGVAAAVRPLRTQRQLLHWDVPLMILCSVVLAALLWDGRLGRPESAALVTGLTAYLALSIWQGRRVQALEAEVAEELPPPSGHPWWDAGRVAAGLVMLVAGAHWLVLGASDLATAAGVSEAVIGLTVVAVGTSLPELATSIVAASKGEGDIAIGNVVGSNLFNLLAILGVAGLVRPLAAPGLEVLDLAVMVGLAVLVLPLLWSGLRLTRPEGALLLALYAGYVGHTLS